MFQRILVPVDRSARSEKAVPYAEGLARAVDAEVIICYVITKPVTPSSATDERDAAAYVTNIAERFRRAGVVARTVVKWGDPPKEIREAAVDWGADAICMATRARKPLDKLVLGSVADVIVRESRLPVLLVSGAKQTRRGRGRAA